MFEITADDIGRLNDEKLRELIGLLCEAELRSRGCSTAYVTWGGSQTAADGGLDVRVDLPQTTQIDGFIPRPKTGFQVKKNDMPPSVITPEMSPKGCLRATIQELAAQNGAYIIVSANGSTSDSALENRRRAMKDAMIGVSGENHIALDFYDRNKTATWVRNHPGIILWVRNAIGRTITGWEPFDAWAYPAGGMDAKYILDDATRIHSRTAEGQEDLACEAGLRVIRNILNAPQSVVRLIGLSGVGKTRFVQALFDNRVAETSLDPSYAIYTNMNNAPDPQPVGLVSDLIANGTRAVVIVDNCPSDLHFRLSEIARKPSSLISIITVEYDIRDDQAEGTEVFEIQAASTELIEKLITERFPGLSRVDICTATELSGGNARIAIALAATVSRSGSLAGLNDDEVFQRLFFQRHDRDKSLLEAAQACSLVYSYNGEDLTDGPEGELTLLGNVIEVGAGKVYSATSELLARDLAQRRGIWRAILPHAVANRLAHSALRSIPISRIEENLVNGGSERLATSFSRRLGYLHSSPEAVQIVRRWIGQDGWLRSVWNFNTFGYTVFRNILPVDPEAALEALEAEKPSVEAGTLQVDKEVAHALRLLAYDPNFFGRCVALIEFVAINASGDVAKDARDIHKSLFQLYLSGTHASPEQRLAAVRRLLFSDQDGERTLGLSALGALLESFHFNSHYDFGFGARSRDYGYGPKTLADVRQWYLGVLALCRQFFDLGDLFREQVAQAIASEFRGLWARGHVRLELEQLCGHISSQSFWPEGWVAVRQTRFFDEKDKTSENFAQLSRIEQVLAPRNLVENVRARVLGGNRRADLYAPDNDSTGGMKSAIEKGDAEAEALGESVAQDAMALEELIPDLVTGQGLLWHFGIGLARGNGAPRQLWTRLTEGFAKVEVNSQNIQAVCGFLQGIANSEPDLANDLLDEAIEDGPLARNFPVLQMAVGFDARGMDRLHRSLEIGKAPIRVYNYFGMGRVTDKIDPSDLARLLRHIADQPEGIHPALHVLYMRFFSDRTDKREHPSELVNVGRELLSMVTFVRDNRREPHELSGIIQACLLGDAGYPTARHLCAELRRAIGEFEARAFENSEMLAGIFTVQPRAALDELLGGDSSLVAAGIMLLQEACNHHKNPMDFAGDDVLLEWCKRDGNVRFPSAAATVTPFLPQKEGAAPQWTPIALRLIDEALQPEAVLQEFVKRFRPTSWSGSRATIIETNAKLLYQLDLRDRPDLKAYVDAQAIVLQKDAKTEREWEAKLDRGRDERFE